MSCWRSWPTREREKDLIVKNEFDKIYTTAGASGMNAGTTDDFTVYFINVPANKLELWFWMESDRLLNPVFREFYSERDVVHEERRMRTDSTPTGKFEEEFDAMFWTSSPYTWPVVGWPSDLDGLTREEALRLFRSELCAQQSDGLPRWRFRSGEGQGAGRSLLRAAEAQSAATTAGSDARGGTTGRKAHGGLCGNQSGSPDPLSHRGRRPRG